jgi:DNA-binding CsgD family transcriptional regulator
LRAERSRDCLTYLCRDLDRPLQTLLRVQLGRVDVGVSEPVAGGLNAELLAHARRPRVPQLVRVPRGHQNLFRRRLRLKSVGLLVSFLAGVTNGAAVGHGGVALAGLHERVHLLVGAGRVPVVQRRLASGESLRATFRLGFRWAEEIGHQLLLKERRQDSLGARANRDATGQVEVLALVSIRCVDPDRSGGVDVVPPHDDDLARPHPGKRTWVRVILSAVRGRDQDARYVVKMVEDITPRKRTEARSRRARKEGAALLQRFNSLTDREQEVFWLMAAGKPTKNIAADLGASPKTIEVHRARVMEKMSAESIAGLAQSSMRLRPLVHNPMESKDSKSPRTPDLDR